MIESVNQVQNTQAVIKFIQGVCVCDLQCNWFGAICCWHYKTGHAQFGTRHKIENRNGSESSQCGGKFAWKSIRFRRKLTDKKPTTTIMTASVRKSIHIIYSPRPIEMWSNGYILPENAQSILKFLIFVFVYRFFHWVFV